MLSNRAGSVPHYTPQRLLVLTLWIMLAAANSACANAGGKDYFPLADGARWEYAGQFHSACGETYEVRAVSRVDGEILINGRRYFKFVSTVDFSAVPTVGRKVEDVRYYRLAGDGIYVRPGGDASADRPDLLEMPLPIPTGVRWLSGKTEVQAESAGALQVNGREYKDCLKVTFKLADGVHTTTNFYAPGVGIVKMIYVNTTEPKSTAELTLERYVP